jgi:hypothetical protein
MKKIALILLIITVCGIRAMSQGNDVIPPPGERGNSASQADSVVKNIRIWKLADDFSLIDSIAPDTLFNGFQNHHPALKNNPFIVHLGNFGTAYQPMVLSHLTSDNNFIFYNALQAYIQHPEELVYYNTTVPYTNLTYYFGSPKRRSTESMNIIFTQNVNKNWNVGVEYNISSSVGHYDAQKTDNQKARIFSSYQGKKYAIHGSLLYTKLKHEENGGLQNDDEILNPVESEYDQTENIPVMLTTSQNRITNRQLFLTQSLGLGKISINDTLKGNKELPVSTIFHTLHIDNAKRIYAVDDLNSYYERDSRDPFYPVIYGDSLRTRDSVTYTLIRNTFQIKFNEEANSLLKFGLRAYIDNEVKKYSFPLPYSFVTSSTGKRTAFYHSSDTTLTTTSIGGQIFKNTGKNFWWNAGMRFYFQGYRAGDSELTGQINSLFPIGKDTAGIYASGGLFLQSPGLFMEYYNSNHLRWNKEFSPEKTLKIRGGIKVPTKRFELSGEVRLINDHIYWNQQALPDQTGSVLQLVEINLSQHFKIGHFNNLNRVVYQVTSHPEIIPLPQFSAYTSNYFEGLVFKVLRYQAGAEMTWFSAYHAPSYMPATGQFFVQNTKTIGEYPFVDVFINLHLKRARIGLKMEHVNQGLGKTNYFSAPGYPIKPRNFQFAVSWNFYD